MVRLHQEAIAESAAHAMHLEADINAGTSVDLQSLSKELETQKTEKEAKPEEPNEMVWHPYVPKALSCCCLVNTMLWTHVWLLFCYCPFDHSVLKELVPLKSLNLEWESWRDH